MASRRVLVTLILLGSICMADLNCNGFEYSAEAGSRDALPTGVCIDFGSFSSYYQCTDNDTISRLNFASTDCSGSVTAWIDDVCAYDSSIQTTYDECSVYCNLEPCDYVLVSLYPSATTCEPGYTSGVSPWTLNSPVADYCAMYASGSQHWTCNATGAFNTAFRSSDCSGDPWYTVPIPSGDSCQEMTSWVNAYHVECGVASEYLYPAPTARPTLSPVVSEVDDDTVTIYVTRDAEPTGEALLGTFECDGLSGQTLENYTAIIETGTFRAFLYDSPRFGRKVIYLNDEDTGRVAIEIHAGNYARNTIGCILVGDSRGMEAGTDNGAIWNSGVTLDALIAKVGDRSILVEVADSNSGDTSKAPSASPTKAPAPSTSPTISPVGDVVDDSSTAPRQSNFDLNSWMMMVVCTCLCFVASV